MAQEWARNFYKSSMWIRCRNAYIQQRIATDGGQCEECHNNPGYIVHHKTILTAGNISDPDISLNADNLEYVCKDCHDLFDGHGVHRAIRPLCRFDASGQPISLREIDKTPSRALPPNSGDGMTNFGPSANFDLTHRPT